MKKIIVLLSICSLVFFAKISEAQNIPVLYRTAINVDSVLINNPYPVIFLKEVNVYPRKSTAYKNDSRRRKLELNFKKVYPVALQISKLYDQVNDSLYTFNTEKERRKYMKYREKQIINQFKPQLVKFTLSQSVLLVKLLDRETGSTAYEIIDELKGSVKAFFWQGFAKMFGNDLKKQYDSQYKDKEIEYLVRRYREGSL